MCFSFSTVGYGLPIFTVNPPARCPPRDLINWSIFSIVAPAMPLCVQTANGYFEPMFSNFLINLPTISGMPLWPSDANKLGKQFRSHPHQFGSRLYTLGKLWRLLSITHKLGFPVNDDIPSGGQILKSLPAAPDRGNPGFAV
jgi:hypothetical protein